MSAHFIDRLADVARSKRPQLVRTLRPEAEDYEAVWRDLTIQNWHPLPSLRPPAANLFGVDGSLGVLPLVNSARLVVVQALARATTGDDTRRVDVDIVPGGIPIARVRRYIDFWMRITEIRLAEELAGRSRPGDVVFLDGSLYGQLLQTTYRFKWVDDHREEVISNMPIELLETCTRLFDICHENRVMLMSIAKTSGSATHCEIWAEAAGEPYRHAPSTSEALHRWTDGAPGFSTPVFLGRRGFRKQGTQIDLERANYQAAPAIVSLFVRLRRGEPPLLVELPAWALGEDCRLVEIDSGPLGLPNEALDLALAYLSKEYISCDMYNVLLYHVDRSVRLHREDMANIYRRVVERELGVPLEIDRSARRFLR